MGRGWWTKFILLLVFTVGAGVMIIPTLANLDLEKTKFFYKQKINLGLDLQGGLYLTLGVDFNQVYTSIIQRQSTSIEGRMKDKAVGFKKVYVQKEGAPVDDPRFRVEFEPAQKQAIRDLIKSEFLSLRLTEEKENFFEFALAHTYRKDIRDNTINQSIEVIRNRIDEFGVSEPTIASQGEDRVLVELPGVKEVDRAKALIGRTAKLEFKIAEDEKMDREKLFDLVIKVEKEKNIGFKDGAKETQKFSEYVALMNDALKKEIPEGTEVAFERVRGPMGETLDRIPYLLKAKADVTGDDLADAQVRFNPENQAPYVSFEMNPRGAVLFEKLTGENVGKRLAIVLDGSVFSAPVIRSQIGAHGQIELGQSSGDKLMKEAKDLAIVLRAGSLPAKLEFMEERVVGPSLGLDSIKKGTSASLIGIIAVFLFVLFYYRFSGAIAVVSLLLNVIFVLAIFVGLGATLTLPGIAGIALTVGIAVDSNVVIYERIREEMRLGKPLIAAVESGFDKAFRTILDANVTNAAAAIILLNFGTGPVKGFAVTMLIGIVTTLFTAVFFCRLMFDLYLKSLESKTNASISI